MYSWTIYFHHFNILRGVCLPLFKLSFHFFFSWYYFVATISVISLLRHYISISKLHNRPGRSTNFSPFTAPPRWNKVCAAAHPFWWCCQRPRGISKIKKDAQRRPKHKPNRKINICHNTRQWPSMADALNSNANGKREAMTIFDELDDKVCNWTRTRTRTRARTSTPISARSPAPVLCLSQLLVVLGFCVHSSLQLENYLFFNCCSSPNDI